MTPCGAMTAATARGVAPCWMHGLRTGVPRTAVCALRAAGDRASRCEAVSHALPSPPVRHAHRRLGWRAKTC